MTLMLRLKAARDRAGLTQQQVADAAGMTQPGYARLENGKVKSTTYIAQLARALGVDSNWLATGKGESALPSSSLATRDASPIYGDAQSTVLATPFKLGDLSPIRSAVRRLPLLSMEQVRKLERRRTQGEAFEALGEIEIDEPTAKELSMDAFALLVEGSSMEPDFRAGDILIVSPEMAPKAGCYVLAETDPEIGPVIRKYRERGRNAEKKLVFELVPANSDYATEQVVEGETGRVIGVVIEHRRKLI